MTHKPNILVVQECEHTNKLLFNTATQLPKNFSWFGGTMRYEHNNKTKKNNPYLKYEINKRFNLFR